MASVAQVKSVDEFKDLVSKGLAVVHFWASWAEQCKQMDAVMTELARLHPVIRFGAVEAEELPAISEEYDVTAVPTIIMYQKGKKIARVDGADAYAVSKMVDAHKGKTATVSAKPPAQDLDTRLKALVNSAPVLLFMKGTPDAPECGFSRKIVGLLNDQKIEFSSFNILADQEVREGLKKFSDWPTFPQLYIAGELVGGLDIVAEMIENGQLAELMESVKNTLNKRLETLINKAPVMLFMKGVPDAPECGFSRKIVGLLNDHKIEFSSFNILADQEVRAGLKKYSDWPTYPQLYVSGELVGGLDIVKEMIESGQMSELIPK